MNRPLDHFESALLEQLREEVTPTSLPAASRGLTRPLSSARWPLGVAAAAAVAIGVTVLPRIGEEPAYSVVQGNSGEIIVEVDRPEDAAGLVAELARYDVVADITYVPDHQRCAEGRYTEVERETRGLSLAIGADMLRVTLPPGTVREGETFVLALSSETLAPMIEADGTRTSERHNSWVDFAVAAGPVAPCEVVEAPTG